MQTFNDSEARAFLRQLFDAAIASANPFKVLASHLPEKPKGRCIVVGAGKASAAMAAALEQAWPDVNLSGVVVTRYGHAVPTEKIRIIEASHPVPDANSALAATEILKSVSGLTSDDLVIALISGGGSALLVAPAEGLTLADKQAVNKALLQSGAGIGEMNIVRKHLSRIKGGKLATAAAPAKVATLVISDVPGDDPAIIASGPTVPDTTTPQDALAILTRYKAKVPDAVLAALGRPQQSTAAVQADVRMIASPMLALRAAAAVAQSQGITPLILGDALEGEAHDAGKLLAGMAISAQLHGLPAVAPCVLLSGGETTVTIHMMARRAEAVATLNCCCRPPSPCKAVKTSGPLRAIPTALTAPKMPPVQFIGPDSLARARATGLDARAFLAGHDSYSLFKALGDLVITGPTLTNVNDFRAILVLPQ